MGTQNSGAIFKGTIGAGVIVAGEGASASLHGVTLDAVTLSNLTTTLRERNRIDLAARFDELAREVRAHAQAVPAGEEIVAATCESGKQLAEPKPNRFTRRRHHLLLDHIREGR